MELSEGRTTKGELGQDEQVDVARIDAFEEFFCCEEVCLEASELGSELDCDDLHGADNVRIDGEKGAR